MAKCESVSYNMVNDVLIKSDSVNCMDYDNKRFAKQIIGNYFGDERSDSVLRSTSWWLI